MERLNPKQIKVEIEGTRLFAEGKELTPSIRRLGDLKGVLVTHGLVNEENKEDPLYYMYRGIGLGKDGAFGQMGIRYDITVIPRYKLGREFNKTLGHYHPIAENGLSYPEIYEVIKGKALYIFQKRKTASQYLVDLIYAKAGDKVLVPPNYGHITSNIGDETLVMANIQNGQMTADYQSIIKMHGGAVYALDDGEIILNRMYRNIMINVRERPERPPMTSSDKSLYDDFVEDPKRFEFLNRPSMLK